jgi:hypothetical protein
MRVPALACAALILLPPAAALADGMEQPKLVAVPSGWTYQFTPYAWDPWVTGDAVVRGRSFSVDVTPIEVLEDLNFAWMSYQQAKNGPLTLFTDVIYADEASGGSMFRSRTFSPHVAGSLGVSVSDSYRYWTVEAGGTYEVASWNSHGSRYATPDTEVELLAGGRYWRQDINVGVSLAGTLNIDGLVFAGDRAIARSGTHEWIDPFIGARVRFQPHPGEELIVRGDIGGFGAGSQFTWQALATYTWQMCSLGPMLIDGYAGWRALQVDYETGSGVGRYEFDVLQQGPVVGFTGRF